MIPERQPHCDQAIPDLFHGDNLEALDTMHSCFSKCGSSGTACVGSKIREDPLLEGQSLYSPRPLTRAGVEDHSKRKEP